MTLNASPAAAQKRLSDPDLVDQEEVCGPVSELNCIAALNVTLETPGRTWVTLNIRGDAKSEETRDAVGRLRGRNVCARGHLTKKADSFSAAQFAVAA